MTKFEFQIKQEDETEMGKVNGKQEKKPTNQKQKKNIQFLKIPAPNEIKIPRHGVNGGS